MVIANPAVAAVVLPLPLVLGEAADVRIWAEDDTVPKVRQQQLCIMVFMQT